MLNGKLALHDVEDTEALCAFVIRRSGLELSRQDREELLTQLIEDAWRLSLRYDNNGLSFSTWATTTLKRRVVDWQRQSGGRTKWVFSDRTYERELPDFLEYDDTTVVGTSEMDLGERVRSDSERMDGNGNISPAAYLPPRSLYLHGRDRRPPEEQAERDKSEELGEAA